MGSKATDNQGRLLGHKSDPPVCTSASPAALALHNNFKLSVVALKRDLVRSIHFLCSIKDQNVHRSLGFHSIFDYAERTAGFTPSQTKAFLNIGRRLGNFPELKRALGKGDLSWSKARQIVRKAEPETEKEWLDLARTMTTDQLSKHEIPPPRNLEEPTKVVPSKPISSIPPRPAPKPANEICHVTFAFTPEEYSKWEKLNGKRQGESKESFMLRGLETLQTDSQGSSTSPHLIVIHECPSCDQATLSNARGKFKVEEALLKASKCDATVQSQDGSRRAAIPSRLRRQVMARDHHQCQHPKCRHGGFLQIHHRLPVAQGGSTELENLVTLCSACHRRLHEREIELRRAGRDPVV